MQQSKQARGELIAQTETTNSPNRSIGAVSPEESSAVEHFRAPLVPFSVAQRTMGSDSGLLASTHTNKTSSQKRSDALLPWRYSIKLSTSNSHTVAVCAQTDAVISRKRQALTN
jgi:hypothetical protein